MKSFSVAPVVRLALCVGGMVMLASLGFAQQAPSSGKVSEELAYALFCDTAQLLEGDFGLMLGLILVFMGLWSMIQGATILKALPVMIVGALVTAIPSLIISSALGLGQLLNDTGISDADVSSFIEQKLSNRSSCPNSAAIINPLQSEINTGDLMFDRAVKSGQVVLPTLTYPTTPPPMNP